jgi:hypothetical protein
MIRQRDYSLLYMQQAVAYTWLYTASSVSSATSERSFSETHEILLKVDYWRRTAVWVVKDVKVLVSP